MNYIDEIVGRSLGYERFFQKKVNGKAYEKLGRSLLPFRNFGQEMVEKELSVMIIPYRENHEKLSFNRDFMDEVCKGQSAYLPTMILMGLFGRIEKSYFAGISDNLVICRDDVNIATLQHEFFHFVYSSFLNESTREEVEKMFQDATEDNSFVHPYQKRNEDEYFAYGGQYYLHRRKLLSPHKKLKRKDPRLFDLAGNILDGQKSLLKAA